MIRKPSSPLKKVKVKSPKIFFANKKNKTKETSPGSTTSTNSDNISEVDTTPVLSNSVKKMDSNASDDFPTIPNLLSMDDESVAAMSDIQEREHSLGSRSWNDLENDDEEYYKQDYFMNGSAGEESTLAADGGEGDGKYNLIDGVEEETSSSNDGDGNMDNTTTPQRGNRKSITAAVESSLSLNSMSPSGQATPTNNTPKSKVSFDDDEKNTETPQSLKIIDVLCATPNSTAADESLLPPITPLEQLTTPGGSTNAPKVLKQNKKLRTGRKELLKIIGSTNKQFREYEEVASRKIFELEERICCMEKGHQKKSTTTTTTTTAIGDGEEKSDVALVMDRLVDAVVAAEVSGTAQHANLIDDKSNDESGNHETKTISLEERSEGSSKEQEQQDSSKEKVISSLKIRCKTLKHRVRKTEKELELKRKVWENEVDMLSEALEKNNEALDYSITELERLRKWKLEHDQKEEELRIVSKPMQASEEEDKPEKDDEEKLNGLNESESDLKSTAAMKEMELTVTEKEQQIERLEGSLKEKGLDIVQLQTDLDSCFKEIETLKELVNKTAAAKGYEDFQDIVENLQDEAIKSESKATAFNERVSELESQLQLKNDEIAQLKMSIEEGQKSLAEKVESVIEASPPKSDDPDRSNPGVESESNNDSSEHSNNSDEQIDNFKSIIALSSTANDPVGISSPGSSSHGASSTDSRRWTGLSFARRLAKEGRQYAAAVGNANDPDSMLGMLRERDRKIYSLEATIETNTMMIEKLKKDEERMDTEHEEALLHSTQTIKHLEEENAVYLQQVKGFEKAFMTLNESQQTTILPSLDEPEDSVASDKDDDEVASKEASEEDPEDLKLQNAKLERMLKLLQGENSFQEDQIEKLKSELTTLRVVSQQEQESACEKLRGENKIMEAQRTALENQLVEINKSAAILRDSLAQDGTTPLHVGDAQNQNAGEAGSNPILVAQVVMLENANKVLESSVDSLRSDQQEKIAPLLQRIALLEEEKRIMEEETHTKIQCREETISNLEDSLKQATQSRLTKKKKNSALKLSKQLLARATKATSDETDVNDYKM